MKTIQQTFLFDRHVGNGVMSLTLNLDEKTGDYYMRKIFFNFLTTYIKTEYPDIEIGKNKKEALRRFKEYSVWKK